MKIAIDIGTTNIEAVLCDNNRIVRSIQVQNLLSQFGLDVMTRINKAIDGEMDRITSVLRDQLRSIVSSLTSAATCDFTTPDARLESIDIACNTTMTHFLMNYDCKNLSAFPFSPVHTEAIHTDAFELGLILSPVSSEGNLEAIPVNIFPGLSAFVGGDIVSGLSALFDARTDCTPSNDKNILFVDMGTNAEMVYITPNTLTITSAAAGPAFETCAPGQASFIVSALSRMLENGIIDETGLLKDEFFETGYEIGSLHISQKKIRDVQMAKAAIRTGIDILLNSDPSAVNLYRDTNAVNLYSGTNAVNLTMVISGSFGDNLDYDAAVRIGLIPAIGKDNIIFAGNTSLKGAINGFDFEKLPHVLENKTIREIILANHKEFNGTYISNMNF